MLVPSCICDCGLRKWEEKSRGNERRGVVLGVPLALDFPFFFAMVACGRAGVAVRKRNEGRRQTGGNAVTRSMRVARDAIDSAPSRSFPQTHHARQAEERGSAEKETNHMNAVYLDMAINAHVHL